MRVEKFKAKENGKLSRVIIKNCPFVTYSNFQKMLRKKDIKINDKRISKDCDIVIDDEIVFYFEDEMLSKFYEDVYEDENILIVNKKRSIEVVSLSAEFDLVSQIKKDKNIHVFAVHRLDRNTEGLVVFAKNEAVKKELDFGFKNRTFEKFYLTQAYGEFEKSKDRLVAYLKKDNEKSLVYVSDKKLPNYDEIQTNYIVLKQLEDSAILEIELITGKTHQIRAHLAHIGHFVIGDDKYGNHEVNKKYGKKYQNLIAYKLILHFSESSKLNYLNGKVFEIDKNKIDFLKNL